MSESARRIPGETGVWLFILGDMSAFAVFFMIFAKYHREFESAFLASKSLLNTDLAVVNTIILLTSSIFVVWGLKSLKRGKTAMCRAFLILAVLCAISFSVVKYIEYSEKVKLGYGLVYDQFFSFYYMLTGIHLLHVIIGTVVLSLMCFMVGRRAPDESMVNRYESGAAYWHMVDLLWIVLFPLLYLVR